MRAHSQTIGTLTKDHKHKTKDQTKYTKLFYSTDLFFQFGDIYQS